MKKQILFSFFCFYNFISYAGNWHPFPFRISYYSRPVSFGSFYGHGFLPPNGPVISGKVVEGMYLDSSYQSSGNSVRARSAKFITGQNWYDYAFAPHISSTLVTTSEDSSEVLWLNKSENSTVDSLVFYPKTGTINNGPQSMIKSYEEVLGTMDSVVTVALPGKTIKWSKNFGILEMDLTWFSTPETIRFIGAEGLVNGWKPFPGKPALPKSGDEIHIRTYNKFVQLANGPQCPPQTASFVNREHRIKVIEYPYQGNASEFLIDRIVSDSSSNTGLLYSEVVDTTVMSSLTDGPYRFHPPGTFEQSGSFNSRGFGYYIDNQGMTCHYVYSGPVIDGAPTITFIPCGMPPFNMSFSGSGSFNFCTMELLSIGFPLYIKSQNSCTMGTPLPPVTITSISKSEYKNQIQIFPNPASSRITIRIPDESVANLDYELFNAKGQISRGFLSFEKGEGNLKLNDFSPGLYTLRISDGKTIRMQKLVLE